MEILLIIGGVWLLFIIIGSFNKKRSDQRDTRTYTRTSSPRNDVIFRPSARLGRNSKIIFQTTTTRSDAISVPTTADLDGLHDAFTGAPLDKSLGLHQCQSCKVYYHTESFQVLRDANASQCVACQSANIIAVGKTNGGKDYTPNVVTLQNYKQHVGSVVTFEGRVHKVNKSRRGKDFAVMFENKPWVRGFKLVFFPGAVRKVGGESYINNLSGKVTAQVP